MYLFLFYRIFIYVSIRAAPRCIIYEPRCIKTQKGRRITPTPSLLSGFIFSYLRYFFFCLYLNIHTSSFTVASRKRISGTVESNKNSFTDDELKTLNEDIETIRKIEEQIAELENKNTSSDDNKKDSSKASSVFSDFSGEDFDGNKVDDSLFSGNAVTVVNFWFTGCKPCVAELSKLNELNDAIKSMLGGIDNKDNYDALMKQIQSVIDADSTNK